MAFHPYPRVIPSVFNRSGFGPPRGLTPASACPWIAHPASRPRRATHDRARLKTRFRCGSVPTLTSPRAATRWLILQKARRHTAQVLRLLAGARFQVLFHSPPGVLFTFPSRYSFAIGHRRVFSLGGWSPLLRTGFHVPGPTREIPSRGGGFAYGAVTRCGRPFHAVPLPPYLCDRARGVRPPGQGSLDPHAATRARLARAWVWARAVSLAATPAISFDFSSSGYLDVSVPRVVPRAVSFSGAGGGAWPPPGSPVRRSRDQRPCAPPPGLSQLAASFVDFLCQGIRRAPLVSSLSK